MAEFYKLRIARWNTGTDHLNLEQEAAYLRIVNAINLYDHPISDNLRVLAGLWRCNERKAKRLRQELIDAGKIWIEAGLIFNEMAMDDVSTRRELRVERASSGRRGGLESGKARRKSLTNKECGEALGSTREEKRREEDDDDPRARAREDDIPFDQVDETDRLLAEIGKASGIDIGRESDPRGRLARWKALDLSPEAVLEEVRAVMRRKGNGRGPPKSLAYFDQAMQDAADHKRRPERRRPTTGGTNDRSGPARKSREQRARETFEADLEFARSLDRGDQPAAPGDGDGPDDG